MCRKTRRQPFIASQKKKKTGDVADSTGRILSGCRHSLSARKTRRSTFTAEPSGGGRARGGLRRGRADGCCKTETPSKERVRQPEKLLRGPGVALHEPIPSRSAPFNIPARRRRRWRQASTFNIELMMAQCKHGGPCLMIGRFSSLPLLRPP